MSEFLKGGEQRRVTLPEDGLAALPADEFAAPDVVAGLMPGEHSTLADQPRWLRLATVGPLIAVLALGALGEGDEPDGGTGKNSGATKVYRCTPAQLNTARGMVRDDIKGNGFIRIPKKIRMHSCGAKSGDVVQYKSEGFNVGIVGTLSCQAQLEVTRKESGKVSWYVTAAGSSYQMTGDYNHFINGMSPGGKKPDSPNGDKIFARAQKKYLMRNCVNKKP